MLLLGVPTLYLVAALIGGVLPQGVASGSVPKPHKIQLIQGPIHTDFVLPLTLQTKAVFADLRPHHPLMDDPAAQWLLVGWGAAGFYTTVGSYSDLTLPVIWRGATGDSAVMRVDVLGVLPPSIQTPRIALSDTQFGQLLTEIRNDFAKTAPLPQRGFGTGDLFYPAVGRFNILETCNVWVGRKLRAAGVRFGRWTPLPLSVQLSHRFFAGSGD